MKCRFLSTGHKSAIWNMGVDESVLTHVSRGESPPTLRLYGWKPPAVSIGYFQGLSEEVDLVECGERGVDVVRRITGGGAVYHDKELTYSYIAKADAVPEDILKSYELICGGLIEGFRLLGVEAEFAPLNDIIASGRKISGNAQTRRMNCVLQHGTVLLNVDVALMFSLLKVPDEKVRDKLIAAVQERVTSLRDVLNREIPFNKAADAFRQGFGDALDLEYEDGSLTEGEVELAGELADKKYSQKSWNNKR